MNYIELWTHLINKHHNDYLSDNVCEEWLSLKVFINWCKDNAPSEGGLTKLVRVNDDIGYYPENCYMIPEGFVTRGES